MHPEAVQFTEFVKKNLPTSFTGKTVLDVGSGDINGNNASLFNKCMYVGNDVFSAPNVTIVSKTSALPYEPNTFDTIISTECFEHDPEYELSFKKIIELLKPGGLFVFTCASTGRPEHGTRRTSPNDSYGTIGNVSGWSDYYKNITFDDLNTSIDVDKTFTSYASYYNTSPYDLYFWGIKKGGPSVNIPIYSHMSTVLTNIKK